MKTILRTTEQHDLGKLTFAFVMLNIYLDFSPVPDHLVRQLCRKRSPGIWTAFAATGA